MHNGGSVPVMTSPSDPWSAGVESWWRTMNASRQALEDLGQQLGRGAASGSAVTADDLAQLLDALGLLERGLAEARQRVDGLEERLAAQEARGAELGEQLLALTGVVSTLVDRAGKGGA